jgi:hypothetical protein
MSRAWDHQWNTEAELEFVKGLGSFNEERTVSPLSREGWLLAYHETMGKRVEWGKIERERVEKAVREELVTLQEVPCQ